MMREMRKVRKVRKVRVTDNMQVRHRSVDNGYASFMHSLYFEYRGEIMTSKKNISKTSVIVISIVLLTGLFLDSLPPLLQTVVAQVQNSDKSVTNNQVISQIPAQVAKANPGGRSNY